jgi:hypothetical protein
VVELCRFRTANHKLPIEIGRWNYTNRNNRICTHCNKNELGDEFHYILDCPFFEQDRNIYIPIYKGNNKITELRTILQRESQNS